MNKDVTDEARKKELFYHPKELKERDSIKFISDQVNLTRMIEFFDAEKPDVIGLDSEWRLLAFNSEIIGLNLKKNKKFLGQLFEKEKNLVPQSYR